MKEFDNWEEIHIMDNLFVGLNESCDDEKARVEFKRMTKMLSSRRKQFSFVYLNYLMQQEVEALDDFTYAIKKNESEAEKVRKLQIEKERIVRGISKF